MCYNKLRVIIMEIWKNIDEDGVYQVSNMGRIRSFAQGCEKIIKFYKNRFGYYTTVIGQGGRIYAGLVHRLVAMKFVENPHKNLQVNHKNEIKTDNRAENLEWCSAKYNSNYGTRNERISKKIKGQGSRKVYVYDLKGNLIDECCSTLEAEKKYGIYDGGVSRVCRGQKNTVKNLVFSYSPNFEVREYVIKKANGYDRVFYK